MSKEDEFKRASLRGRGWKILRGTDQPTDEFADSQGLPFSSEDAENLLAVGPPPLGMLPPLLPDEPETLPELEDYEPDLLPTQQDELGLSTRFETKELDIIPPSEPRVSPLTANFDEPPDLPPDMEAMFDNDELSADASTLPITDDEYTSQDFGDLTDMLDEIGALDEETSQRPSDEAPLSMPVSELDDDAFIEDMFDQPLPHMEFPPDVPELDEPEPVALEDDMPRLMEKDEDDEPTYVPAAGEAIPAPEAAEGELRVADLEGYNRPSNYVIDSLIPGTPERSVPTEEEAISGTVDYYAGPEGVGPGIRSVSEFEAVPLVEDIDRPRRVNLSGSTHMTKNDLIPTQPETPMDDTGAEVLIGSGGIYVEAEKDRFDEEFVSAPREVKRVAAGELFESPSTADPELLSRFVSDDRLNELWALIEYLQNEISEQASSDRERTDVYQQELLLASELLLESRENYDDARAVVYRVRTDIKRDQRIASDIALHRPRLLTYIVGWIIGLGILSLLRASLSDLSEDAPFLAAAYLPTVFGAAGGLFLAYSTLNKHTSVLRDFDPIHMPWYLFCPLVGGVMGFLSFMLWVVGVSTTVTQDLTDPESLDSWPVAVWLLAFYAGIQQNWVLSRLRALRDNFGGGEQTTTPR